ncbi:MAG: 50S ribosomal protein L9 [bacterium]|nr:50S ribosomal protein L9 [bacterium]
MKVLLKTDVERLGVAGDAVTVKDGFARNYLIPRGFAMIDSPGNRNTLSHVFRRSWKIRGEKQKREAQKAVQEWGHLAIEISMRVGDDGKMFGAVTSSDIAEQLLAQKNITIDRRKLQLDEPLKAIGEHLVPLKLHAEVAATIHVHIKPVVEAVPEEVVADPVPANEEDEIPESFRE